MFVPASAHYATNVCGHAVLRGARRACTPASAHATMGGVAKPVSEVRKWLHLQTASITHTHTHTPVAVAGAASPPG